MIPHSHFEEDAERKRERIMALSAAVETSTYDEEGERKEGTAVNSPLSRMKQTYFFWR